MTAEFSDLSVGAVEGIPGWNTVIVRTAKGQELLEGARKAGMSADRMIHECLNNEALRDYLAELCINAANEVGA
jgi:coenzyme F420-reducing hydrogenase beta subunit